MDGHRSGDKPLPEPVTLNSLMYMCVIRPQYVKVIFKDWPHVYFNVLATAI